MHATDHATDSRDDPADRPMSLAGIRSAYADHADTYARFEWADRLFVGRYRRRQFGDADGRVLDVACGTGTNFPYLPDSVDVVGVDLSPEMLAEARDRERDATLHAMDAQELAFPDDSFDTVISALSTCTFPNPVAALDEMARVCRPDGRVLLLEHGESDVGPIARYQHWRGDAHYEKTGCRWTQDPLHHVAAADLAVDATTTTFLGMLTGIEATPA